VALRIMAHVAERFECQRPPPTLLEIATALGIPSRLAGRVVAPLHVARLLVEVRGVETAYAPGAPLEKISCEAILQALRAGGGQELETRDDSSRTLVRDKFEEIRQAERTVAASVTLKELVNRTPPHGARVKSSKTG
jgi:DNA-binding IscR family transcriptional regulator